MKNYKVHLSRLVTQNTVVPVKADSKHEAENIAVRIAKDPSIMLDWHDDKDSTPGVFLSEPGSTQEVQDG